MFIAELATRFSVSVMTIRRDLDRLEARGLVERRHGGAILPGRLVGEETYAAKAVSHVEAKKRIGEAAATLVNDGDIVLMDAGTTTLSILHALSPRQRLTIVTDDLALALEASQIGMETYVAGGRVQRETGSVIGGVARDFFERLSIDIAFIGASSVSNDGFVFTTMMEKATVKSAMMRAARKSVLVVDESKFGAVSFVKLCPITEFDVIISDHVFSPQERDALEASGIAILEVSLCTVA